MDYDEDRIYYSYQNLQTRDTAGVGASDSANPIADDKEDIPLMAVRRHFREFLRMYRQKQRYVYRDRLLRMHQRTYNSEDPLSSTSSSNRARGRGYNYQSSLTVDLAHVGEYDPTLLGWCLSQPAPIMPVLEIAAVDALKTLLVQQRSNDEDGEANEEDPSDEPTTQNEDQEGGEQDPAQNTATNEKPTVPLSPIQILLRGNITPTPLRSIQSTHMNTLLSCTGIIISASRVRSRATSVTLRCTRCQHVHTLPSNGGPFSALNLPRQCLSPQGNECGLTPYAVVPDDCGFVDQQTLKLQEAPEAVPTGEMPRSVLCAVERNLVDKAPPGTRVRLLAIVSLLSGMSAVKTVYLRIVGMVQDTGVGRGVAFTPREEEAFRRLARRSDVYDILARSMAPSISGNYTKDIKKALTCQLFSGSRKRLPDGMALRGDINVLLLGDPSMAKSQFLKYVTRVAPVGVYTSGKGSSAAGLTASVVRDSRGEFYLEGGAMVLADGGIVAIDEFDKMRPADRVAIHEAMEQQTISVAKAGITTVLNSRSSVLAAANPVFGRYDDMKSASENIDLMTTILSRFDLIFLVRDVRDEELDKMICHHVMGVHINNSGGGGGVTTGDGTFGAGFNSLDQDAGGFFDAANGDAQASSSPEAIAENVSRIASTGVGELDVPSMKKYIQFCKAKCSPRLSEEAGDILASSYVKIRDDVRKGMMSSSRTDGNGQVIDDQPAVPITVRQLEALIRVSESLSKMRLEEEVQSEDIAEALRLFKVSTMAANSVDNKGAPQGGVGANGSGSIFRAAAPSREETMRTEMFLKSRLAIGSIVNKQRIVEEAAGQGYDASIVARAIGVMIMRGELQERNQGRLFKRIM